MPVQVTNFYTGGVSIDVDVMKDSSRVKVFCRGVRDVAGVQDIPLTWTAWGCFLVVWGFVDSLSTE